MKSLWITAFMLSTFAAINTTLVPVGSGQEIVGGECGSCTPNPAMSLTQVSGSNCTQYELRTANSSWIISCPALTRFDPSLCVCNYASRVRCGCDSSPSEKTTQQRMEFSIASLWNGDSIDHEPMKIHLEQLDESNNVKVIVSGKFFNDPPAPLSHPGPTDKLWDYEVVEAFFLNSTDQTYMEVEFGPHGHHIVLLLQGRRNPIKTLLPLTYAATISEDRRTWYGEAFIPLEYFPPGVDKFNAFAIHGSDPNRQYQQLYPQKPPKTQPDFHRLQDFEDINFGAIIPPDRMTEYSKVWTDNMTK